MTAALPARRIRALAAGATATAIATLVLLAGPSAGPAHACTCMELTDE